MFGIADEYGICVDVCVYACLENARVDQTLTLEVISAGRTRPLVPLCKSQTRWYYASLYSLLSQPRKEKKFCRCINKIYIHISSDFIT